MLSFRDHLGGQLNDFPIRLIVALMASSGHSFFFFFFGLPAVSTACGSEVDWFLVLLKTTQVELTAFL